MALKDNEIGLDEALALVKAGKSIFVWVGGETDVPLSAVLGLDRDEVVEADPFYLLDKSEYPKALLKYEKPIFVCHHGISSYRLVIELKRRGINGISLHGGIEEAKKRRS